MAWCLHIGTNFTCPECLTFSVCRSDGELHFTYFRIIDKQAIEESKCDLMMNGVLPTNCQFRSQRCSLNVSGFDFTVSYVVQCPLNNSRSAYHIDSLAQQVGPVEAIELCTSKHFNCTLIATKYQCHLVKTLYGSTSCNGTFTKVFPKLIFILYDLMADLMAIANFKKNCVPIWYKRTYT